MHSVSFSLALGAYRRSVRGLLDGRLRLAVALIGAVCTLGAHVAVAGATTVVRGATNTSTALRIEPGGTPQIQERGPGATSNALFIQRMPATRTVRYVTLGNFARGLSCTQNADVGLRVVRYSGHDLDSNAQYPAVEVSHSLENISVGSEFQRVKWRISEVQLAVGEAYSFQVNSSGCTTLRQHVWTHNSPTIDTGDRMACVKPPAFTQPAISHFAEGDGRGWNPSSPACADSVPSDMPTGWLAIGHGFTRTNVRTTSVSGGCGSSGATFPGIDELPWRISGNEPSERYVCHWPQFNPPGQQTTDGWYYATPWPDGEIIDIYARLGETLEDPPENEPKYVAMGDSFQSGEGAGDYTAETAGSLLQPGCHRSPHAYPELLAGPGNAIPFKLDFVACSGAQTPNILEIGQFGEPAQIDHLAPLDRNHGVDGAAFSGETRFVTIGIGGNDLKFADIITDCVLPNLSTPVPVPLPLPLLTDPPCEYTSGNRLYDAQETLLGRFPNSALSTLDEVFKRIREAAPTADIVVLNYPRFFWANGDLTHGSQHDRLLTCQSIRPSDQVWIDSQVRAADKRITNSARRMGLRPVSLYNLSEGNELCHKYYGPHLDEFLNGIDQIPVPQNKREFFHPTSYGHSRIANRIRQKINTPAPFQWVSPGERIRAYQQVADRAPLASFTTRWPGSDVVTTLRSPSGRLIDRATVAGDVHHYAGPVSEVYSITDPEPGLWEIELYGADVDPAGEPVELEFFEEEPVNAPPTAVMTSTQTGAATVEVSAAGTFDSDGSIAGYAWDFGDGTTGEGLQATHVYQEPGTYRVTLVTRDDKDEVDIATATQVVTARHYPWDGFKAPINNQPTLNATNAGRAIPVKFSLGANEGLAIFAPSSPASQTIDCSTGAVIDELEQTTTAGGSSLSYDASTDTYTYVWKTNSAWAGTCRRLTVTLDDGTSHSADFKLR